MRLIDADACPKLFDAEFKKTKRLILAGEKHLDNLAEGFMEANNVIRSMPTIAQPPNDPLTLDELREMDGEPVWAELLSCTVGQKAGWALVYYSSHIGAACQRWTNWVLWYGEYGKTWTAYRHKQEEVRNAET